MAKIFDLELLQAISDWQRGGDEKQNKKRGEKLEAICQTLPIEFRECPLVCYRQLALPKGGVWKLIGENNLPEKISSWTFELNIAQGFKGGVPPDGQGYQGVILSTFPLPEDVIVNLRALYQDEEFKLALEENKSLISGYHQGAGRYGETQNEVVLKINSVTQEDVFSLGGHSRSLDELIKKASETVYRRPATQEEQQSLLLAATNSGVQAGPRWLNMDATRRVLARTKPKAAILADLKRVQDAEN